MMSTVEEIVKIGNTLDSSSSSSEGSSLILEAADPSYRLRPLGLLVNSFLASENTGTTNELMLARWYINEVYLRIDDVKNALEKGDGTKDKLYYSYLKRR